MDTRPDGDFQSHCSLLFNFLPVPAVLELGVPLLSALAVWYLCALCAGHKILIVLNVKIAAARTRRSCECAERAMLRGMVLVDAFEIQKGHSVAP